MLSMWIISDSDWSRRRRPEALKFITDDEPECASRRARDLALPAVADDDLETRTLTRSPSESQAAHAGDS